MKCQSIGNIVAYLLNKMTQCEQSEYVLAYKKLFRKFDNQLDQLLHP